MPKFCFCTSACVCVATKVWQKSHMIHLGLTQGEAKQMFSSQVWTKYQQLECSSWLRAFWGWGGSFPQRVTVQLSGLLTAPHSTCRVKAKRTVGEISLHDRIIQNPQVGLLFFFFLWNETFLGNWIKLEFMHPIKKKKTLLQMVKQRHCSNTWKIGFSKAWNLLCSYFCNHHKLLYRDSCTEINKPRRFTFQPTSSFQGRDCPPCSWLFFFFFNTYVSSYLQTFPAPHELWKQSTENEDSSL